VGRSRQGSRYAYLGHAQSAGAGSAGECVAAAPHWPARLERTPLALGDAQPDCWHAAQVP